MYVRVSLYREVLSLYRYFAVQRRRRKDEDYRYFAATTLNNEMLQISHHIIIKTFQIDTHVWALWWQGGKRRLRTSRCPCRGRLGTLKTPSCPWRGCPAAGQNLENWTSVPLLYSWNIAECDVKPHSTTTSWYNSAQHTKTECHFQSYFGWWTSSEMAIRLLTSAVLVLTPQCCRK